MAKRNKNRRRGEGGEGKPPEVKPQAAAETADAGTGILPSAGILASEKLLTPLPRPRSVVPLALAFAAYLAWMGVLVWIAARPPDGEPVPVRSITASEIIAVGRTVTAADGAASVRVDEVLRGPAELKGRTLPLTGPAPGPGGWSAFGDRDSVFFLQPGRFAPGSDPSAPPPYRLTQPDAKQPPQPPTPVTPLVAAQVRQVLSDIAAATAEPAVPRN
jgi:hypothetical protein